MNNVWGIVGLFVLLAANAFFVAAEFALVGARRSQIEPLAEQGSRRAKRTLLAMERVSIMMAGAQLGITLCSIGLGAMAEPAIAALLEPLLHSLGVSESLLHPISFVIALAIVMCLHVVLGEMVPKNLTLAAPDRAALALGSPMSAIARITGPVIRLLNASANVVLRMFGVQPADELASSFNLDEVAALVQQSHREGMLDDEDYRLMSGAVNFVTKSTAAEVAIPWQLVSRVPMDATVGQIERLSGRTRHLRFPVVDAADHPQGYVLVKDLLVERVDADQPLAADRIRQLPPIPADTALPTVLEQLRHADASIARVVHPTNHELIGIITLDDVVSALIR